MNHLIYGESNYFIKKEIKKIIGEKTYQIKYASETSLPEILNDIKYASIFDENKVVIIKEAEKCFKQTAKDDNVIYEDFKIFLKENKDLPLILVSDKKISERLKINKELLSLFNIHQTISANKSSEYVNIFTDITKKEGFAFTQAALYLFANKCSLNIDVGINELKKLKLIGKIVVSEEDVENFVSNYNMDNFYGFKDSVINKDIPAAVEILKDLEASKANLISIVISLAKEYQTIYNVKELAKEKLNNDQISIKLNHLHPYRVKILREAGNKYTFNELENLILYLSNLNYKLVSQDNLGFAEIKKFLLELIK